MRPVGYIYPHDECHYTLKIDIQNSFSAAKKKKKKNELLR